MQGFGGDNIVYWREGGKGDNRLPK